MDPIKILRELAPIRPGATRACEYVKLEIEFENDRVKRVSKPYLETPFMD